MSSKRKSIYWEESNLLADEPNRVLWDVHIQRQLEEQERQAEIWPRYEKQSISLFFFVLSLVIGAAVVTGIVYTNNEWGKWDALQWISHYFSFLPLITLQLYFGVPQARYHFSQWMNSLVSWTQVLPIACTITFCWLTSTVFLKNFDPLALCFVFFMSASTLGAVKQLQVESAEEGLTPTDAVVWLILWIPLDLRWFDHYLWLGNSGMSYDWWASAVSILLVVAYGCFRDFEGFGYRLIPHWKDIVIGLVAAIGMWLIVLPIGLGAGFLKWSGFHVIKENISAAAVFSAFGEIFTTVAITEELFYRAILMNGIHHLFVNRWKRGSKWIALVLSSLAFGLMHWPRETELVRKLAYLGLAFLGGLFYGSAYLFSGNNILAGAITHALTDTMWMFIFP